MTSVHERVGEAFGVGERYCLDLDDEDGDLVAPHPEEGCDVDVVVTSGLELLGDRPPAGPVLVEIQHAFDGNRIVGRVVRASCRKSVDVDERDG